ncbi:hypothetical protein TVAG_455510 [Trichomonas vaginalis G3]|uniref:Uncharacterized protein n=1 Tax=Trichomonas vaginalis (strain ATCC PRA-98 / G3) TaxID=412133 RepID=A2FW90_TRIV3|nr:hypothetical protein TVAGG3_0538000 [Trichomonas vaginalis G3]EAX90823.1 hypothetical protein TVAG_455510 [Trichomonas vaginalis G3]KAI5519626.1 hypothetical protein TVAGG3_0538000 [Trichomonas vaginalis G3]|eukprot:XP_001303753.1 hypothetical protein [Trichomonas vaginalis G3]
MQYIDFKEILKERFKACIYVYVEPGIEKLYPNLIPNFKNTWKKIENLGTYPFNYRLVYMEPDVTSDEMKTTINDLSFVISDPSAVTDPPELPWFRYWVKLFFDRDKLPPFLFLDIPVCIIYLSTVNQRLQIQFPQWAANYTTNIMQCNIVVNPQLQKSNTFYQCNDDTAGALYDHILNITHFKAPQVLRDMKESITKYVDENWHGFSNSFRRLLGFGGKVSREQLIITLKQLGDVCLSMQDFDSASKYYQQLYQELIESDPKVEDSLLITMAVTSLLSTDELNLRDFFLTLYKNGTPTFQFYQSMFIMCYYCATHNDLMISWKILMRIVKSIIRSDNPFKDVAYPLLFEAAYFSQKTMKGIIVLYRTANSYMKMNLRQNEKICLWRIYHKIKGTGWPNLEEFILMRIAATDDVPFELQNVLQNRNINFINDLVTFLKKLELEQSVPIGSLSVHNLCVQPTGFPMSPPPLGISSETWNHLRKKLFPVVAQSSTDKFVASAWGSDALESISIGVGEYAKISFVLQPNNKNSCNASNLSLLVEGDASAESEIIENVDIQKSTSIKMKLKPTKSGVIIVRGVTFLWNGVAPVFAAFNEPLKFDSIKEPPLVEISSSASRKDTFPNHPVFIKLKTITKVGRLTSLHVVTHSSSDIEMIEPQEMKGNRYSLDSQAPETESEYKVCVNAVGKFTVDFLVSYTSENHVVRFAHCKQEIICNEFPPLKAISGNDTILLRSDVKIEEMHSNAFELQRSGDIVKILNPKSIEKKAHSELAVKRTISGIETNNSVKIPDLFARFYVHSEISTQVYPFYVDMTLEIVSPHNTTHNVHLKQPNERNFFFIGKTHFSFDGMSNKVDLKILVIRPFTADIGELLNVDGISRFHKILSVK